jgi:hypothetical protein
MYISGTVLMWVAIGLVVLADHQPQSLIRLAAKSEGA